MIKLYTDAATKGNFGLGGAGILIVSNQEQTQLHLPLPAMSNHEAEFAAARLGLERVLARGDRGSLTLISDSKILIDSLDKRYAKHYQAQVDELLALLDQFSLALWQWVPEKQNRGAHTQAQQGLREAEKQAE